MKHLCVIGAMALAVGPAAGADPAGIKVDKDKKAVIIDAKAAPRKLAKYDQVYPIEVIACFAYNEGVKGKAHETVLITEAKPSDVHKALESLGLKPGKPEKVYGADVTGTLLALFPVTDETVLQTSLTMAEEKYLKLEANTKLLPKEGTAVELVIEVPAAK